MFYEKLCEIYVMGHQNRSATITQFARVSYHISTKKPSKISMVESFLRIFAGLPGRLSYVDLLFFREQIRKDSTGDIISGVLKIARLKAVVCRAIYQLTKKKLH